MKKLLATCAAGLLIAGFTATSASAQKQHRGYKTHGYHQHYSGGPRYQRNYRSYNTMRSPRYFGGNAAMSGNHGNSAYGSNSLGHIEGGNIGGGK